MDWSKIKTVLIWIFAFVNLFLLSVYFVGTFTSKTLDEDVILGTVEILRQNNIEIDKETVPKNLDNVKICSVENKFADVKSMLETACNSSDEGFLNTENIEINGENFVCKLKLDKEIRPEKLIKKSGLLSNGDYKKVEKDGEVYYYLSFENKVFFDSYIKVKSDGKNVEIYGKNWLGDKVSQESVAKIVSPAEILINFSTQYNGEKNVKINSMTAGYFIGERNETVRATASPVWEISTSDGDKCYYDMRNGDLLK